MKLMMLLMLIGNLAIAQSESTECTVSIEVMGIKTLTDEVLAKTEKALGEGALEIKKNLTTRKKVVYEEELAKFSGLNFGHVKNTWNGSYLLYMPTMKFTARFESKEKFNLKSIFEFMTENGLGEVPESTPMVIDDRCTPRNPAVYF